MAKRSPNRKQQFNNENKGIPLTEESLNKMLQIQEKEVINQAAELKIRESELKAEERTTSQNVGLAKEGLKIQEKLIEKEYELAGKRDNKIFWGAIIGVSLLLIFFGFCIVFDATTIVREAIYYIGTAIVSFVAGRASARRKGKSQRKVSPSDEGIEDIEAEEI